MLLSLCHLFGLYNNLGCVIFLYQRGSLYRICAIGHHRRRCQHDCRRKCPIATTGGLRKRTNR